MKNILFQKVQVTMVCSVMDVRTRSLDSGTSVWGVKITIYAPAVKLVAYMVNTLR